MKLSRVDVVPVLAIIFGGAVSALLSSALVLRSTPNYEDAPELRVVQSHRPSPKTLWSRDVQWASGTVSGSFGALLVEQIELRERVGQLPEEVSAERVVQLKQFREQKDQMHQTLLELEQDLGQLTDRWRQADYHLVAIALRDAHRLIGESKIGEKILYSRGTIEQWDPQSAATLELSIENDIRSILARLKTPPAIYVDGYEVQSYPPDRMSYDFERIEVVGGAVAVRLYGVDAAERVILLSTKGASDPGQRHAP